MKFYSYFCLLVVYRVCIVFYLKNIDYELVIVNLLKLE